MRAIAVSSAAAFASESRGRLTCICSWCAEGREDGGEFCDAHYHALPWVICARLNAAIELRASTLNTAHHRRYIYWHARAYGYLLDQARKEYRVGDMEQNPFERVLGVMLQGSGESVQKIVESVS